MEIALFSDIHSNDHALETCLQYTKSRHIKHYIFLGDYAGELPYAQNTMSLLYQLQKEASCHFIRGNREEYMLKHLHHPEEIWPDYNSASGCLLNTFEELTEKDFQFFEQMPQTMKIKIPNMPEILCCHGSPDAVGEYVELQSEKACQILQEADCDYVIYGHTHIQGIYKANHKQLINPGSIGSPIQSKDGKAQFAILHSTETGWETELISLEYPLEACIQELYESTLPKRAPVWCRLTEYCLRNGVAEKSTSVLKRAIELCTAREGTCTWPFIPERDWEQAASEMGIPFRK